MGGTYICQTVEENKLKHDYDKVSERRYDTEQISQNVARNHKIRLKESVRSSEREVLLKFSSLTTKQEYTTPFQPAISFSYAALA